MRLLALALGLCLSGTANAGTEIGDSRKCGLGAVLGQPTGISGKCYIGGRRFGWDAVVAWEFLNSRNGALYLHTTAQWHPSELVQEDWGDISWYVGAGPILTLWFIDVPSHVTDSGLFVGARAPVGVAIDLNEVPVQIFTEVALVVGVYPSTRVGGGGGIGARYYF